MALPLRPVRKTDKPVCVRERTLTEHFVAKLKLRISTVDGGRQEVC